MLDAYPSNLSDTGGKMRKGTLKSVIASALMALLLLGLPLKAAGHSPDPIDPPSHSQLLVPLLTPITKVITDVGSLLTHGRDMKLLVVSADGTEPGLPAIRAILGQIGVPYDVVVLTQTGGKLPALNNHVRGFYQGIILTTGNLATCTTNPCSIALPPDGWLALDRYAARYGVRTLSYYTFPDPRYGLEWTGSVAQSGTASFLPASAAVFPDLNRSNPVAIADSYTYRAATLAGPGETTTPVLTLNGDVVAATHRKADGREYLALTLDNSPTAMHSLAFGYGLVNWVTKGVFLGHRKANFSPQVLDLLLGSDLYSVSPASCQDSGLELDPTLDPSGTCPNLRITGADLDQVKTWQDQVNTGQTGKIKVAMAYNGIGTTAAGGSPLVDSLAPAMTQNRSNFFWVSHTYDHANLDSATRSQALAEIDSNRAVAQSLNLVDDTASLITPGLSGLDNPNVASAAASRGIRYLVSDASAVPHNTGIPNQYQSSILMIPARPTNIFYNVSTAFTGVPGSEPDKYNYLFGPNGIIRVGGPGGPPFFTSNQTYAQIIARESDFIVKNMLRGEVYPVLFHQANLSRYNGVNSLLTDLGQAVMDKFRSISSLPVNSRSMSSIGGIVDDRMEFNSSGVSATLSPGIGITIRVSRSAKIPVTGVCSFSCESNGGQSISYVSVGPLFPKFVSLW